MDLNMSSEKLKLVKYFYIFLKRESNIFFDVPTGYWLSTSIKCLLQMTEAKNLVE